MVVRSCPEPRPPNPEHRRARFLFLSVLVVCGCAPSGVTSDWHRIDPPIASADFTLPQLDGGNVSLSGLRGHVVVMEFWATWCGPCRYSTPSLEVIYRKFRERGVVVLLINHGEPEQDVRAWAERRFTAPILLDAGDRVADRYGVQGIPSLFIIDQTGRIVYAESGYRGGLERNLKRALEELLAELPPPTHA